jgi:hypothetical protein
MLAMRQQSSIVSFRGGLVNVLSQGCPFILGRLVLQALQ